MYVYIYIYIYIYTYDMRFWISKGLTDWTPDSPGPPTRRSARSRAPEGTNIINIVQIVIQIVIVAVTVTVIVIVIVIS